MTESPRQKYDAADRFHKKMVEYIDEYRVHILLVNPVLDPTNNLAVTQEFVNYLFSNLIKDFDEITVSIANSKFYAFFIVTYKQEVPKDVVKGILKDFFTFLYGKHGIKNEKLMKGFEEK